MLKKSLLPTLTLACLVSCAPTLKQKRDPNMPLPQDFPVSIQTDPAALTDPKVSTADMAWKQFFHDDELASLIDTALKNNQDLNLLEQDIFIANNEVMSRQGEYLPKVAIGAGGGVEKIERFSTEDANSVTKFGQAGAKATWELDIWKKLRNASKSAYYTYLGSIEGRRFMVTNLVAEIANTYFELLAQDNQLEIVKNYVDLLTQIQSMADSQMQAGRMTSLPVKRFQAEVLKNKSRQYKIQQDIIMTSNKLNTLMGRLPQDVPRDAKKFAEFSFMNIAPSVPTHLIDNRPDIKRASLDLEAAKLNVKVARARFYPSLSIDGSAGYENFNSKHFENPTVNPFYSLIGNVSAPLLNRKAIKADYFSANNKQIQAVYNYELTVIKAYTDVVNQLNMINNLNKIFELKTKQVDALKESIEISNTLFRAARVDYMESLFTQRDALEAQVELVEIKKQQLSASVELYRALGGGWKGVREGYESNY